MNLKHVLFAGILVAFLFVLNSCSKSDEDPEPCLNDLLVSVDNVKASVEGKSTGEIMVSATGGTGSFMFSIDGTNFQSSGTFSNLEANDYTVVVKDANECTDSELATVAEIPEVFYANEIRPIIDANCQVSGCHGSNGNIPTFATYNDVFAKAERIKVRTGDKTMPRNGSITDGQIKLIADWVDQGAPNN